MSARTAIIATDWYSQRTSWPLIYRLCIRYLIIFLEVFFPRSRQYLYFNHEKTGSYSLHCTRSPGTCNLSQCNVRSFIVYLDNYNLFANNDRRMGGLLWLDLKQRAFGWVFFLTTWLSLHFFVQRYSCFGVGCSVMHAFHTGFNVSKIRMNNLAICSPSSWFKFMPDTSSKTFT